MQLLAITSAANAINCIVVLFLCFWCIKSFFAGFYCAWFMPATIDTILEEKKMNLGEMAKFKSGFYWFVKVVFALLVIVPALIALYVLIFIFN